MLSHIPYPVGYAFHAHRAARQFERDLFAGQGSVLFRVYAAPSRVRLPAAGARRVEQAYRRNAASSDTRPGIPAGYSPVARRRRRVIPARSAYQSMSASVSALEREVRTAMTYGGLYEKIGLNPSRLSDIMVNHSPPASFASPSHR